MLDIPVLF